MFYTYLFLILILGLLALVVLAVRTLGEDDSRNLVASLLGLVDTPLRAIRDRLRTWGDRLKALAASGWAGATGGRFGDHPVWAAAAAIICGSIWVFIVYQQWGLVSETLAASGHGVGGLGALLPGGDGNGLGAALAVITIALSSLGGLILWDLLGVSHILPSEIAQRHRRPVMGLAAALLLISIGVHVLVGSHRAEQICTSQRSAAALIGTELVDPAPLQLAQAEQTRQAEFDAAQVDCDFNSVFDPLVAGLSVILEAIVSFAVPLVLIGLAGLTLVLFRVPVLLVALLIGVVLRVLDALFALVGFLIRLMTRRRDDEETPVRPEGDPGPAAPDGDGAAEPQEPIDVDGGSFHGGAENDGSSNNGSGPSRDPEYAPWG